jgi:hypothetical protein
LAALKERLNSKQRCQDASDQHGEHDRIAKLAARIKFFESVDDGPAYDRRIEQGSGFDGCGH